MENIFISYKREQHEWVSKLVSALESYDLTVWWDPKIEIGEGYHRVITEVINKVDCVLVVWSNDSVHSEWVISEATIGKNRQNLVPVLRDDLMPPLPFNILQSAELMDWDGLDHNHAGFKQLLFSIQNFCKIAPSVESKIEISVDKKNQPQPLISSVNVDDLDTEYWKEALNRNNKKAYKLYLEEYPKGKHYKKAIKKIKALTFKTQLFLTSFILLFLVVLVISKKEM